MTVTNDRSDDAGGSRLQYGDSTALTSDDQQMFLHRSTAAVVCGEDDQLPRQVLDKVVALAVARVQGRGVQDRAALEAQIAWIDKRLAERRRLRDELVVDRQNAASTANAIADLVNRAARVKIDIRLKRTAELQRRVEEEAAKLEAQRARVSDELRAATTQEFEKKLAEWNDTAGAREQRATELRKALQHQQAAIDAIVARARILGDKLITKTVAGFLSWLGYATVPATGAVLAMLLDGGSFSLDWIVLVTKSFSRSLLGAPVWQFVQLVLFFAICLAALLGAVLGIDKLIRKFDKRWEKNHSEGSVTVRLGASEITRRSFVRLLSALPYMFGICMLLAFGAVGGQAVRDKDLVGVVQTITNTFIGSAIALLTTGVFMMYAIRIIEPRESGKRTLGAGWEFAVAPIALLIAVGVALSVPTPDRFRWAAWTLFMLLSSLSLAYGLVYHGIYKDADKALELAEEFEKEIQKLTKPPERLAPASKASLYRLRIEAEYARDAIRLERLARSYRIPIKPNDNDARPLKKTFRSWLQTLLPAIATSDGGPVSFDEIDAVVARDLVEELGLLSREEARLRTELARLQEEIRRKEELTDLRVLEAIEGERSSATGESERLLGLEAEVSAHTRQQYQMFELAVRAAVAGAVRLQGPFDSVAGPRGAPNGSHGVNRPPLLLDEGNSNHDDDNQK